MTTRNRDLDVPGLGACEKHDPAVPVMEYGEVLFWLCRNCGARCESDGSKDQSRAVIPDAALCKSK